MSIFRRDQEPSPPKPQPQQRPAPSRPAAAEKRASVETTHIANGSKVVGEISGKADIHVDGHVEGSIRLENGVVIGADGRVDGPIEAGSIHVGGKVTGSVYGRDRVEVQSGGSLEGDVTSPRVVIDPGAAFFRGKIEMSDKAPRPPQGGGTAARGPSAPPGSQPVGATPGSGGAKSNAPSAPSAPTAPTAPAPDKVPDRGRDEVKSSGSSPSGGGGEDRDSGSYGRNKSRRGGR